MMKFLLVLIFATNGAQSGVSIASVPEPFATMAECQTAGDVAQKRLEGWVTNIRYACLTSTYGGAR